MTTEQEINRYSYWEHFKAAKDLALVLPPDHPKRVAIEKAANEILGKLNDDTNDERNATQRSSIREHELDTKNFTSEGKQGEEIT